MTPPTPSLEELLARASWVRALAARLVSDSDAADDLTQDALVVALTSGVHVREPQSWLAGVVRNLARRRYRSEGRRAAREQASAQPEEVEDTTHLVERAELQSHVIRAVTSLEEPYRTTVLLRFFEGLTVVELSRRMGVPASTGRTRLARALERLRARFDDEHDGDRAAWCGLLGTLVPKTVPPLPLVGKPLLAPGFAPVAVGVLLLAAAFGGWLFAGRTSTLAPSAAEPQPAHVVADSTEPPAELAPATVGERRLVDAPPPPVEGATGPAGRSGQTAFVRATLRDENGRPLQGAEVRLLDRPAVAYSDAAGEVELAVGSRPRLGCTVVVRLQDHGTRYLSTVLHAGQTTHLGELILPPAGILAGSVNDAAGAPVAGARVFLTGLDDERADPAELRRTRPEEYRDLHSAFTGADGSFELDNVEPGFVRVWAQASGFVSTSLGPVDVVPGLNAGLELVLSTRATGAVIAGVVLSPQGQPVPDAPLSYHYRNGDRAYQTAIATDGEGRFEIAVASDVPHGLLFRDHEHRWPAVLLDDVEAGSGELVVRFAKTRPLRVRVADPSGTPLESFRVRADFAGAEAEAAGYGALAGIEAEHAPGGLLALPTPTVPFRLEIHAPGFQDAVLGPFEPDSAPAEIQVRLTARSGVQGRVLVGGRPLAGAKVTLSEVFGDDVLARSNGFRCRYLVDEVPARTDADGRFEVYPARSARYVLRADSEGYAPEELELDLDPRIGARGIELTLGRGGAIEGRLLLPAGEDPAGRILALNHGDGMARTYRIGPEGTYRFEGLAAGGWRVELRDEERGGPSFSSIGPNPSGVPIEWSCVVVDGETARFDVDARRRCGGRLLGWLALGAPVGTGWTASLEPLHVGAEVHGEAASPLNAEGRFDLGYPEPGLYRLAVRSPEGASRLLLSTTLDLSGGDVAWEERLPLGSVRGTLTPGTRGSELCWAGALSADGGREVRVAVLLQADELGAFEAPFVPAGPSRLDGAAGPVDVGVEAGRWTELDPH
ncbi:MAG: sigma-70 family RNA polymerase sigma factor [Planctomycetota bacterium]